MEDIGPQPGAGKEAAIKQEQRMSGDVALQDRLS